MFRVNHCETSILTNGFEILGKVERFLPSRWAIWNEFSWNADGPASNGNLRRSSYTSQSVFPDCTRRFMKMKMRRLALAAVLLSGTSMAFADNGSSSAVGDLPGYGEDAYFDEDAAYVNEHQNEQYVVPASHAESALHYQPQQSPHNHVRNYAPIGASELQPAGFHSHGAASCGCEAPSCDGGCASSCDTGCAAPCGGSSCDGGCDSGCSSKQHRKICSIFDQCGGDTWGSAELLLWFTGDRPSVPLVGSSNPGSLPVLPVGGANNVTNLFGDTIDGGELSAGVRLDYGKYISDNVGIGGRFWTLAENSTDFTASSDGVNQPSIGLLHFDTAPGFVGESSLLIGFSGDGVVGNAVSDFVGSVSIEDSLDLLGAEAYARLKFSSTKSCRLDFLGGFSYFQIDNDFGLFADVQNPLVGRRRTYLDRIEAENRFYGGQVGFEMVMNRGKWQARSLTKVHLGNMEQTLISGGAASDTTGAVTSVSNGGLYTLETRGTDTRDEFTFVPEANFKLGYRFRKNVLLTTGYSFLYFDDVALAANSINRNIGASANLNTTVANPNAPSIRDGNLFVHGVDLGVVIDF